MFHMCAMLSLRALLYAPLDKTSLLIQIAQVKNRARSAVKGLWLSGRQKHGALWLLVQPRHIFWLGSLGRWDCGIEEILKMNYDLWIEMLWLSAFVAGLLRQSFCFQSHCLC